MGNERVTPRTFVLALAIVVAAGPSLAGWNPPGWELDGPAQSKPNAEAASPFAAPFVLMLELYSQYISPVDGSNCPSNPSCSAYAKEAFKKRRRMKDLMSFPNRHEFWRG